MSRRYRVEVDQTTLMTSRPGVFAGGDCNTGPSTLIHAMASGLQAARSIDDWIQFGHVRFSPRARMRNILNEHKMLNSDCVKLEYRAHPEELDPEARKHMFEEVERTISPEEAYHEATRCMRCYRIYSVITQQSIPEGAA